MRPFSRSSRDLSVKGGETAAGSKIVMSCKAFVLSSPSGALLSVLNFVKGFLRNFVFLQPVFENRGQCGPLEIRAPHGRAAQIRAGKNRLLEIRALKPRAYE
jgi:hypothetical protein